MAIFDNFPYTNIHDLNLDWLIKTVKKVYDKTETVDQAVLEVENLTNEIKDMFITPEMFGAIGDGTTDDSQALQDCFNYAKTNGRIVILKGTTYRSENPLYVGKTTIIGSGKDGNNTILEFAGTNGIIINDRSVRLENVRIIQNDDGEGVGIDFDDGNYGTIPDVYLNYITVLHFEYGLRAVKSSSWSNTFNNIRLQFNKNALYFDSFAPNLTATQFCNEFNNLLILNVNGGKSIYLRGAFCIFNNANVSCTSEFCIDLSSSYVQFNSCSFENDYPIISNIAMMRIGKTVDFTDCRFVHNYITTGSTYFMYSQINTELHIRFINCHEIAYTGSTLTALVYPAFGSATNYGSVYEEGNTFSIYDTVYNNYKSFIQRAGQPLTLYSASYDISKLKEKTVYEYIDEGTQKKYLVYLNGTQLYNYDTNKPLGVISEKTTFTPALGTDDGCYYEVIDDYLVHIHLAVTGLTNNTSETIYTIPTSIRRSNEALPFVYFSANSTPSRYTNMAYGLITTGGAIFKYRHASMYADIYYALT